MTTPAAQPLPDDEDDELTASELTAPMRRVVAIVAALNLLGFFAELAIATAVGSVSLFADAADFLEDVLINTLVLFAITWPLASRRRASYVLAGLILLPAGAALATAVRRLRAGGAPEAVPISATGLGAPPARCRRRAPAHRHQRGRGARGAPRGADRGSGARARRRLTRPARCLAGAVATAHRDVPSAYRTPRGRSMARATLPACRRSFS